MQTLQLGPEAGALGCRPPCLLPAEVPRVMLVLEDSLILPCATGKTTVYDAGIPRECQLEFWLFHRH